MKLNYLNNSFIKHKILNLIKNNKIKFKQKYNNKKSLTKFSLIQKKIGKFSKHSKNCSYCKLLMTMNYRINITRRKN